MALVSLGGFASPSICRAGFILRPQRTSRDLAIADYTKAIELNPKDQQAYWRRGLSYGHKGQCGPAIADYSKAIELNPKDQRHISCGVYLTA